MVALFKYQKGCYREDAQHLPSVMPECNVNVLLPPTAIHRAFIEVIFFNLQKMLTTKDSYLDI